MTLRQLSDAWRAKKGAKAMPTEVIADDGQRPNGLNRSTCESLVLHMLGLGILSDDFHFTAFSIVHYVVTGARAHSLESGKITVTFEIASSESKASRVSSAAKGSATGKTARTVSGAKSCNRNTAGEDTGGSAGGSGIRGMKGPRSTQRMDSSVRTGGDDINSANAVVDLCDSGGEDVVPGKSCGGESVGGVSNRHDIIDADGWDDDDSDFEGMHHGRQQRNKSNGKRKRKAKARDRSLRVSDDEG